MANTGPNFGEMKGHGAFGFRDNLRDFTELLDQSVKESHILAKVQPVIAVKDWAQSAGNIYVTPFEKSYAGVRRDVVSVSATSDQELVRGETATLSAGQFYYEPDEEFDQEIFKWDQEDGKWQIVGYDFASGDHWLRGSDLTGERDGTKGTVSFWYKCASPPSSGTAFANVWSIANSGTRFQCFLASVGTPPNIVGSVHIQLRSTGGGYLVQFYGDTTVCDGDWHHVMASWDTVAGTPLGTIWVDGVQGTNLTLSSGTIDYTQGNFAIGSWPDGTFTFDQEFGQLWLSTTSYIDLTNSANRDLLYDSTNGLPTGIDPTITDVSGNVHKAIVLLDQEDIGSNRGYGGAFADQGSTGITPGRPNHTPAIKWDQFPKLYVNLTDGSNPNLTTVVAHLGFHFASKAQSHPTLGSELLTDGNLDNWDDANNPTSWTSSVSAGSTIEQSTDVPSNSFTYSAKQTLLNNTATAFSRVFQNLTSLVDGATYRYSGWYKTPADETAKHEGDFQVRPLLANGSPNFEATHENGREWFPSGSNNVQLNPTHGEWRRFSYDFYASAPLGGVSDVNLFTGFVNFAASDSVSATAYYTGLSLKRIWRYEFYEPRITESGIPQSSAGSNDIYFGGKRTSTGTIGFINHDGFWDRVVGQLEWINQKCLVVVGGQFMSDPEEPGDAPDHQTAGQEILIEDMRTAYTGLIQQVSVSDETTQMNLQDLRAFFHNKLPKNLYTDTTFANMDTKNFQGKPRPLFFGVKTNIRPVRIDYETNTNKYGQYEICDTGDAPNGIKAIDNVYAYTNETEAALKDSNKRIALVEDTHYTVDLDTSRFTIDVDVGPYEIEAGVNDIINWDEGGAELTATITEGLYTAATLATEIGTQMTAGSGGTVTCAYSDSTNKFTLTLSAGTFNLRLSSGTNKDKTIYKTLGYTDADDKTGSLSYAGDEATFTATKTGEPLDVDKDHIIRVNAQGFKDDASGTFTGSANALIEIGSDICRVLLLNYMDRVSSTVDNSSFIFARTRAPESLTIFLNESTSTKTIFDRLEFSNVANIVVDGDGVVYYLVYVGVADEAALNALTQVHDWDIQSFVAEKSMKDVYQTVRVLYDQDPTLGTYRAREKQDSSVSVRLGRLDIREFITYVKISDNAITLSGRMLELSKHATRKIKMGVLGGLLIDHKVGDQIAVSRERSLGSAGRLSKTAFRIISIKKDYIKGLVHVECVDDIATVASKACITACQIFCESQCQTECELSCELDCEISGCESGCEVACQDLCQEAACQLACEPGISCETGCELDCQDTCESVCQACEAAGCQEACEENCQTTCELTCQGCAQTTCETVCQGEDCKQSTCQVSCQDACIESGECQNACAELGCRQSACEVNCQDACAEYGCQNACESDCQTQDELNPDI